MLEMRPTCECCDRALPPDFVGAMICSFECTFCEACARERLGGTCPNCNGPLVRRPPRPAQLLARSPASTTRVVRSAPCPSRGSGPA